MRTSLTAPFQGDYQELVASFEQFVARELRPLVGECPESAAGPPPDICDHVRRRSAELGFYAPEYPQAVGGSDAPLSAAVMLRHAAGRSGCYLAHYALASAEGPSPLLLRGTAWQREQYLAPLVRAQKVRCLAITEPGTGSDAFRLATTARRTGDRWVINGRKAFVSNADRADFVILLAATPGPGNPSGSTAFLIDKGTHGLRLGQSFEAISGEPLHELLLDDVEVTEDAILGGAEGIGAGQEAAMEGLSRGRLLVAAECNGIAEQALKLGVDYAKQRVSFGHPIGSYQHIQEHLVMTKAELECAELLTLACANLFDQGVDAPENAAMAKLIASETAMRAVDRASRVHGGASCVLGHPLERLLRQVRVMVMVEGTSEIQKVIIAKAMGLG